MSLANKRIFIVEDNVHNRVVYKIALTRHGAQLDFDPWGRQTLQKMSALEHIDLIVLDLMLPSGYSGYDIYAKIRNIPEFDDVPIVAVSAADPSVAIPKTREMGFSGFITKPIDDDLFPEQIVKIINGEQVWDVGGRFENIG